MQYKESDRLAAGTATLVFLTIAILIYYAGRNRFGAKRPAGLLQYREIGEEKGGPFFSLLLLIWCTFIVTRNFGLIRFGNATNVCLVDHQRRRNGGRVVLDAPDGRRKLTGPPLRFHCRRVSASACSSRLQPAAW